MLPRLCDLVNHTGQVGDLCTPDDLCILHKLERQMKWAALVPLLVVYPGGVKTNIMKNAPNLADDRREDAHRHFTQAASLSADEAARRILRAARREKRRLILGLDARLVYAVHRRFPRSSPKNIQAVFGQARFGGDE